VPTGATHGKILGVAHAKSVSEVTAASCAVTCVNGCILGDACPHLVYLEVARKYIAETPWEEIVNAADSYAATRQEPEESNPLLESFMKFSETMNPSGPTT